MKKSLLLISVFVWMIHLYSSAQSLPKGNMQDKSVVKNDSIPKERVPHTTTTTHIKGTTLQPVQIHPVSPGIKYDSTQKPVGLKPLVPNPTELDSIKNSKKKGKP